jgi:hypothetical protein
MSSGTVLKIGSAAGLVLVASGPPSPSERGPFVERVATLQIARAAHTATTLASGQVLLVGGMADGGGSLASVELFDPTRNTAETLMSLAEARVGHTATLLRDGRLLVAGGYNGEYLASLELFDPATWRFRRAGSLVEGRSGHTATLLPDGRVLFIGGVGRGWTFLRSAEVYDPDTERSEAVGSMSVPRESHTATWLADGRVLVIGGHNGRRQNMEVHASTEIFSPRSGRFENGASLGTARHKHDAIRLADGRVLVIGGADRSDRRYYASTEIYDSRKGVFEQGPVMGSARYKIAGTTIQLANGNVLVTSGASVAEMLDRASWTFHEVPGGFPEAYRFAAAATLGDGDVIIAGGYSDENRNTAGIWRFRRP